MFLTFLTSHMRFSSGETMKTLKNMDKDDWNRENFKISIDNSASSHELLCSLLLDLQPIIFNHFVKNEKLCAAPTGRIPQHWKVLKWVLSPEAITVVCCGWLLPCRSYALSWWRVLGPASCIWNLSQYSIPSASCLGLINLHRSHLRFFPAVSPELSAVEPACSMECTSQFIHGFWFGHVLLN